MNRPSLALIVFLVAGVATGLLSFSFTPAHAAPPSKWEFKVVSQIDLMAELYRDEVGKRGDGESREDFVRRVNEVVLKEALEQARGDQEVPDTAFYTARLEKVLERYGAQGWQLAAAATPTSGLILQRPAR